MGCAGLIIARQNNGEGMSGIAPNVTMVPIKIFWDDFYCSGVSLDHLYVIVMAIDYAWNDANADILSCSWGGPVDDGISAAFQRAYENGTAIICAAGNNGTVSYPANLPYVMAVGATDPWDRRWYYSGMGDALDVVAPSGSVLSLDGLN